MTEVPLDVLPDAEIEWAVKTAELPTEREAPLEWWHRDNDGGGGGGGGGGGFGGVLDSYSGGGGEAFGGSVRGAWDLIFRPPNTRTIEAELRHLSKETAPISAEKERKQRVLTGPVLSPEVPPASNATLAAGGGSGGAEGKEEREIDRRAEKLEAEADSNILSAQSSILPPSTQPRALEKKKRNPRTLLG